MTKATIPKIIDHLSYFFSEGVFIGLRFGGSDGLDGGVGISASGLDFSVLAYCHSAIYLNVSAVNKD